MARATLTKWHNRLNL